jgi:hypothetical protein
MLVRVLAAVAAGEENLIAREAQLHALAEIFDGSGADLHDIAPVFAIEENALDPSEREYVDALISGFTSDLTERIRVRSWGTLPDE